MADDPAGLDEPLLKPRAVKRLKERPRLIDFGFRRQILGELEKELHERRKPKEVAENATKALQERTRRPVANAVSSKAQDVNKRFLEGL
jgi:hypothetical protein